MAYRTLLLAGILGGALSVAGCESSGLSPREVGGNNYSNYVLSLSDPANSGVGSNASANARLQFPARLAVAQVGEVGPPDAIVDQLRKESVLFRHIEALPCNFDVAYRGYAYSQRQADSQTAEAREQMNRVIGLARGMSMDYLLLLGGTADWQSQDNDLSVLDLSIVGAFVVPAHRVEATTRAGAALVDVRTGRVVLIESSSAADTSTVSAVKQSEESIRLVAALRDQAMGKATDQIIADCRRSAIER